MATATMDPAARAEAAVLSYLGGHDTDALAEAAVFTDLTTGMTWTGRAAIDGMLDWFYHGVFEAHVEDSRLTVGHDGASVVLEATFVGVHQGEFAGVPATGRTVRIPLVVAYDLRDGVITAGRVHFDTASFLAQTSGTR